MKFIFKFIQRFFERVNKKMATETVQSGARSYRAYLFRVEKNGKAPSPEEHWLLVSLLSGHQYSNGIGAVILYQGSYWEDASVVVVGSTNPVETAKFEASA